jgi:hypothetical protein
MWHTHLWRRARRTLALKQAVALMVLSRETSPRPSSAVAHKNVNPKVVSEMLGHASIAITLDTY